MDPISTSEALMDIKRKQDTLFKALFSVGCVPHFLTHTHTEVRKVSLYRTFFSLGTWLQLKKGTGRLSEGAGRVRATALLERSEDTLKKSVFSFHLETQLGKSGWAASAFAR